MDENLSEVDEEVRGVIEIIAQHISHQNNSTSLTDFVDEVGEARNIDDLYDYLLDNPKAAVNLVGDLEEYFDHPAPDLEKLKEGQGEFPADTEPWWNVVEASSAYWVCVP